MLQPTGLAVAVYAQLTPRARLPSSLTTSLLQFEELLHVRHRSSSANLLHGFPTSIRRLDGKRHPRFCTCDLFAHSVCRFKSLTLTALQEDTQYCEPSQLHASCLEATCNHESVKPLSFPTNAATLQRNPGIVITSLTMSRTCRLSRDSCSLWHSINWKALLLQLALKRCARSCTELQITTGGISENGAARWVAIEGHEAWQTSRPMVQGKSRPHRFS